MRGDKVGPPIEIKDDQTGAPIQIPAKSVFDPHKTLGHYKAPAGKSSLQFGKLKEASDKLAKQVLSSPLTRQESMMLYSAVWLARMRYVLPQCSLSPAQLKTIESKAMMANCYVVQSHGDSFKLGLDNPFFQLLKSAFRTLHNGT